MMTAKEARPVPRVLVADDQQDVLTSLRLLLKNDGMMVTAVSSAAGLVEAVRSECFDAALIDLNYARDTTSGQEGLDLLAQVQLINPALPVIVMTAWATIDIAVEAVRRGARDFLEKPWDNQRVLSILRTQVSYSHQTRRLKSLEAENQLLRDSSDVDFIADSPQMAEVLDIVQRVASADAPVLLTGENGTGKSLIARLIHKLSNRAGRPFVAVNMGAIPDGLFESELFGHVRGAFTDAKSDRIGRFEMADSGTLFLDEIGTVPVGQQAKLLRVVEGGEFERVGSSRTQHVNARLIAATNANLRELMSQGKFRQDLLFRLNTVEIRVPPLRERTQDILPIALRCLHRFAAKYGRRVEGFADMALNALVRYPWPGNVREVGNVVERAVLMARGPMITVADLALEGGLEPAPGIESMSLGDAERQFVRTALRRAGGNVHAAADMLGLSRSAMYRRLEKLGICLDRQ